MLKSFVLIFTVLTVYTSAFKTYDFPSLHKAKKPTMLTQQAKEPDKMVLQNLVERGMMSQNKVLLDKLAEAEAKIEAIEMKISPYENYFIALDKRITSFESGIVNNVNHIKALDSRVTSFQNGIMTNHENISSLGTRFSSVETLA